MTEELTAEERAWYETLPDHIGGRPMRKLLRLYDAARDPMREQTWAERFKVLSDQRDAALARAEAAEKHVSELSASWRDKCAQLLIQRKRADAAESALAEATALLEHLKKFPELQAFHRRIDAFLARTPAPAATVDGCPVSTDNLLHLAECAHAWEPGARLLGNVTARELQLFCAELISYRRVNPTAPAAKAEPENPEADERHAKLVAVADKLRVSQARIAQAVAELEKTLLLCEKLDAPVSVCCGVMGSLAILKGQS